MRIALSGARSTGKTSLATKLSEKLNVPYIGGFARSVGKLMNITPATINDPWQFWLFQILICDNMFHTHTTQSSYITDRTLADVYAYTALGYDKFYIPPATSLLEYIHNHANSVDYDLIVFTPIEFPQQDDGFRPSGEDNRKREEHYIKTAIENCYPYTKIITVSGTIEERINQVMKALDK